MSNEKFTNWYWSDQELQEECKTVPVLMAWLRDDASEFVKREFILGLCNAVLEDLDIDAFLREFAIDHSRQIYLDYAEDYEEDKAWGF